MAPSQIPMAYISKLDRARGYKFRIGEPILMEKNRICKKNVSVIQFLACRPLFKFSTSEFGTGTQKFENDAYTVIEALKISTNLYN